MHKAIFLLSILLAFMSCNKTSKIEVKDGNIMNYSCNNGYKIKGEVSHIRDKQKPFIVLFINGNEGLKMNQDIAASGVRYSSEDQQYSFWEHQGEFTLYQNDDDLCVCRDSSKTYIRNSKSGKEYILDEDNSFSQSISKINLQTLGFESNYKKSLEVNPVDSVFLNDVNSDGKEDFFFKTTSRGSGSNGNLWVLVNINDQKNQLYQLNDSLIVSNVTNPLEGYMGHDTYEVKNGKIFRSFPIYTTKDPNSNPTGGRKTLIYIFDERGFFKIIDENKQ